MALKDLVSLIDNKLSETFNRKEAKPEQLRAPLLKGIEQATKQFENGSTKAPGRWWKASNGVVALTVKLKGETFDINGVATNHFPEERFGDFMKAFKAAVDAGEFDAELKNHGNGDAQVHISKAGGKRGPVSDEAKANMKKAAQARAERQRAAKEAANA
ncbi:hypothetical protein [Sphingomonas sp. BAUL-RG-20F-R05-02]|uniref:hypothetical protein n=1 Tax=Sphingomonas sp. BAUL-RG-20F-R05-02 TaxID=2914830 RepID=UPI001F568AE5|nr:hypothetical protein [Sphingomonas sp. BAUL-RG-20F-R05-02]